MFFQHPVIFRLFSLSDKVNTILKYLLYLDADTIVCDDLTPFYEVNLDGKWIAAVDGTGKLPPDARTGATLPLRGEPLPGHWNSPAAVFAESAALHSAAGVPVQAEPAGLVSAGFSASAAPAPSRFPHQCTPVFPSPGCRV